MDSGRPCHCLSRGGPNCYRYRDMVTLETERQVEGPSEDRSSSIGNQNHAARANQKRNEQEGGSRNIFENHHGTSNAKQTKPYSAAKYPSSIEGAKSMKIIFDWLCSLFHSNQIKALQNSIAKNEQDIEGVRPIAEEAVKRTDDRYYTLRSRVGLGQRRIAYTESALSRDLNEGWSGHK